VGVKLYYLPACAETAQAYSAWCDLVQVDEIPRFERHSLCLSEHGLGLLDSDYATPFYLRQTRSASVERRELVRACGTGRTLLDVCAGFGTDGLALAQHGWDVTLVERELTIWLLLRDLCAEFEHVSAVNADGIEYLQSSDQPWDVVYLDPMFPERGKKALPQRGLQHLRALATPFPHDLADVISLAQTTARERVVVKRRSTDPVVSPPNFQLRGKMIRFDVYLGRSSDSTA
jgi:16S rRNA (guanine1516-N2)-methyltransferase